MPQDNGDAVEGLVVGTPPWAALVCFVGAFVAAGSDCAYIAVGNERSANEGNGVNCESMLELLPCIVKFCLCMLLRWSAGVVICIDLMLS